MLKKKKTKFLFLLAAFLLFQPGLAMAYLNQGASRSWEGGTGETARVSKDFAWNGYLYRNEIFLEKEPDTSLSIEDTFLWHDGEEQLSVESVRVNGNYDVEYFWNPPDWYLMAQNISDYYVDGRFFQRLQIRPKHDLLEEDSWHVDFWK